MKKLPLLFTLAWVSGILAGCNTTPSKTYETIKWDELLRKPDSEITDLDTLNLEKNVFNTDYKKCTYASKDVQDNKTPLLCLNTIVDSIEDKFVKACMVENLKQSFVWKSAFENWEFTYSPEVELLAQDLEELFKECVYNKELKLNWNTEEEMLKNIPIFEDFVNADKGNFIGQNRNSDEFQKFITEYKYLYFSKVKEESSSLSTTATGTKVEQQNGIGNSNNYHNNSGMPWYFWYYLWTLGRNNTYYPSTPNTTSNFSENTASNFSENTTTPKNNPTTFDGAKTNKDMSNATSSIGGGKDEIANSLYKAEQARATQTSKFHTNPTSTAAGAVAGGFLGASAAKWSNTSDNYRVRVPSSTLGTNNFMGSDTSSSSKVSNGSSYGGFGRWSSYHGSSSSGLS